MKDPPTEVGGFARGSPSSFFHFSFDIWDRLILFNEKWKMENEK